jgi:hypothetical protein
VNSITLYAVLFQMLVTLSIEVGLGFTTPFLQGGTELEQSRALRESGLSYYQGANGDRRRVGSYRAPSGWSVSTAFYKPLRRVKGRMLGSAFRLSQTGSEPSEGGYPEGYYFNYVSVGPALKYYPFSRNNLFLKADVGLAAVLTKNRFLSGPLDEVFEFADVARPVVGLHLLAGRVGDAGDVFAQLLAHFADEVDGQQRGVLLAVAQRGKLAYC